MFWGNHSTGWVSGLALGGRNPDVSPHFQELWAGLDDLLARPREWHLDDAIDAAGPRRHHDDAVGQEDSLLGGMGYEDDCLAFAVPDPQQPRWQPVAGLTVECDVGFVHKPRVGPDRDRQRGA